jgi:hypothetical protein
LEAQKTKNTQRTTEQKRSTLEGLQYKIAMAIKAAWYWHKNRHEDKWNRTEDHHMYSCSYAHLNF